MSKSEQTLQCRRNKLILCEPANAGNVPELKLLPKPSTSLTNTTSFLWGDKGEAAISFKIVDGRFQMVSLSGSDHDWFTR